MKQTTRRAALTAIAAGGAGTCLCGLNGGCSTFTKKGKTPLIPAEAYTVEDGALIVMLDKVAELDSAGGSVKVIDNRLPSPIVIARTGETRYEAVSLLCPHRGAEVEYQHKGQRFRCASLGHSSFSTDGTRLKGPAKHDLTRYEVKRDPAGLTKLRIAF